MVQYKKKTSQPRTHAHSLNWASRQPNSRSLCDIDMNTDVDAVIDCGYIVTEDW